MTKRDVPGFAIGGLSGGEEKAHFWRMVTLSTDLLPKNKPRYLMGVGWVVWGYAINYKFKKLSKKKNTSVEWCGGGVWILRVSTISSLYHFVPIGLFILDTSKLCSGHLETIGHFETFNSLDTSRLCPGHFETFSKNIFLIYMKKIWRKNIMYLT